MDAERTGFPGSTEPVGFLSSTPAERRVPRVGGRFVELAEMIETGCGGFVRSRGVIS
jgi:nitrous oxide reductase accessory protein NosL